MLPEFDQYDGNGDGVLDREAFLPCPNLNRNPDPTTCLDSHPSLTEPCPQFSLPPPNFHRSRPSPSRLGRSLRDADPNPDREEFERLNRFAKLEK